ncbi:glycosyltransferase family 2 protein [Imperialibacter roseus]|uniref:Glycosyltransferase family 2 protein n=1 Tax=Imperialibacter roseus TaxID=1324217 RepID=A0ABZ0IP09_9BACT|nr:glycosyltransferase family 2 protein [Imperialibacter roseus]WOK06311.1 glycosyltransferase family 2 protein [Imperialibacter roseus]
MNTVVSIVYVNYNSSALIVDSIDSLTAHCKDVPFEVIIVDNASKVEEKLKLDSLRMERNWNNIQIIYAGENLGFGRANNLGATKAIGKYLFFLNPDTLICNDVVRILFDFLESSEPKIIACGGSLLTADKKPTSSYGNLPGIFQELGNIGLGLSFILGGYYKRHLAINAAVYQTTPTKVPYIVGADIFIYADAFNDLNGFDECFFMYYEETDLFYRLSKKRLDSYIVPDAQIIHLEGGAVNSLATEKFNHAKFEMLLASKIYYYRKWSSKSSLPLFKLIFLLQIVVQFTKGNMGSQLKPLLKSYFSIVLGAK